MRALVMATVAAAFLWTACSDDAGTKPDAGVATSDAGGGSGGGDDGSDAGLFDTGTELSVPVPESGRVYVKLGAPSVVASATLGGDPKASLDWDVAFEGFDVFTNGGASGAGKAEAFGPFDDLTFLDDTAPNVPFLTQDKAGGAFLDWYAYEGTVHALWSRYHVYGVRDGARLWKVQVLTYYGRRDGAAIPALYKIRYAELTSGASGDTHELSDLDGTAGGINATADAPIECLDLATGTRTMLTPDAARTSSAWHLCFHRESINVNGETGGPRGVLAVDANAEKTAGETVDAVKAKTAESEAPAFDATTAATFDGKTFRGDRIVSAFGDKWIDPSKAAPAHAVWLVQDAAGTQKFLLRFTSFQNPTSKSPGTVVVRIKPVKG